jgi:mercuric reductase
MKLVVVGGGTAGLAGARRAAELGAQVTLVHADMQDGACHKDDHVPALIMTQAAAAVHTMTAHPFPGIERYRPAVNMTEHLVHQRTRIDALRSLTEDALVKSGTDIEFLHGTARFRDRRTLAVETPAGQIRLLDGDRILVATGACASVPDISGLADTPFWTPRDVLLAQQIPNHLLIVGGSITAVELGQAFQRLGANVTLVARSTLLPRLDPAIGAALREVLEKEGVSVITDTAPVAVRFGKDIFSLKLPKGDLRGDALLVATGYAPHTRGLEPERAGVDIDARGAIKIDRSMRTTVPHIYAVGDCTDMPQLAHVAAAAGRRAAVNMMGGRCNVDPALIPTVVYTDPPAAAVGMTEALAKRHGLAVRSRTLPLDAVPGALADFDIRGFIKLVAEKSGGRLLGAQLLTPHAAEIIQFAALAIDDKLTVNEVGERLYSELTLLEGLGACARMFG